MLILFTILIFAIQVQTARILAIFPMPSLSHHLVFRPLTQELARKGHEVTVITPHPAFTKDEGPLNLKEINIHNITNEAWKRLFQDIHVVNQNKNEVEESRNILRALMYVFKIQFKSPEVQKLISDKNNKFDLILIENVIRPALVFSHLFKAPVILISSVGIAINDDKIMGLPLHPLLYPSLCQKKIYTFSLTEKIFQIYMQYALEYIFHMNDIDVNNFLQETLDPEMPLVTINELYANVDMLFLNSHPIWADNQPVPPNVIHVGGIHQTLEQPLPKELKTFLDFSKHGVIYFSFGTSIQEEMIPKGKLKIFMNVLSQLPYDVLFKWSTKNIPGKAKNIKIAKWYPQSDLLRHPKVKLFIMQAGFLSTFEAITAGVPLIAFPILADQFHNAEKYVKYGIGKQLDLNSVTEEEFKNAVEGVINNGSYQRNVRKLGQWFLDQPETPLQRAVWWVEYVIRNGGSKHLRSPAVNMSYSEYYEIEIVSIILVTLFIILSITLVTTLYICKLFKKILFLKEKKN